MILSVQRRGQVTTMKNSRTILVIGGVIVVLAAAAVSFLSVLETQNGGGLYSMSAKLRNTIEIPLSQAESLSVDYGSKNLEIYVWQEDRIVIKEYLNSSRSDALATTTIDNGRAVVTGGQTHWSLQLLWGGWGEKIEIYLPESGLKTLELETGSGNITAREAFSLNGESVSVQAGSGNIRWNSTKADFIALQAGSGNIRAEELLGSQVQVKTNSGNITLKDVTGSLYTRAGSGNVTVSRLSGGCEAETGSGNLKVEAEQVTEDISLETGSGNQRLELPEGLSFDLQVNTGSGNISTDYDSELSYNKKGNEASGQVGEAPVCRISSKAGSGNVSIKDHK